MFDKYLPSRFASWFALYQDIKQLIRPEHDTVAWVDGNRASAVRPAAVVKAEKHVYLVRYIHEQTLEELIELRALETFSKDELEILRAAMHQFAGYNRDERIDAVSLKVQTLFIERIKKDRG